MLYLSYWNNGQRKRLHHLVSHYPNAPTVPSSVTPLSSLPCFHSQFASCSADGARSQHRIARNREVWTYTGDASCFSKPPCAESAVLDERPNYVKIELSSHLGKQNLKLKSENYACTFSGVLDVSEIHNPQKRAAKGEVSAQASRTRGFLQQCDKMRYCFHCYAKLQNK